MIFSNLSLWNHILFQGGKNSLKFYFSWERKYSHIWKCTYFFLEGECQCIRKCSLYNRVRFFFLHKPLQFILFYLYIYLFLQLILFSPSENLSKWKKTKKNSMTFCTFFFLLCSIKDFFSLFLSPSNKGLCKMKIKCHSIDFLLLLISYMASLIGSHIFKNNQTKFLF